MTGEQIILQTGGWQAVTEIVGRVILQNSSNDTLYYFIADSAPTTQQGLALRHQKKQAPHIRPSETLYARAPKGNATLVWSE